MAHAEGVGRDASWRLGAGNGSEEGWYVYVQMGDADGVRVWNKRMVCAGLVVELWVHEKVVR